MSIEVVQKVLSHCNGNTTLGWQGGEPTLAGLDFYREVIELCPDHTNHTMMTNATLIDQDWAKFLKKNNFLVGVSIDGTETTHNTHRSQWRETVEGLGRLLGNGVRVNAVVTVNRANWSHGVQVYRSLVNLGITYLQFIPICLGNYSINGYEWGAFLTDVFQEWLSSGTNRVGVQLFDECMRGLMGEEALSCVHSDRCGGFVVEADGDVFCCEHFMDDEKNRLGNVFSSSLMEMADSTCFKLFNTRKLMQCCLDCRYYNLCHGGCVRHRVTQFGPSILCEGYRTFFAQFMAEIVPLY